jgi:hypothetical protein
MRNVAQRLGIDEAAGFRNPERNCLTGRKTAAFRAAGGFA